VLCPDIIVLENVPLGWTEQGDEIRETLEPLGYTVAPVYCSALELGFLHERQRLVVVAVLTTSRFMSTIRNLPFAPLATLIPARVPYSRTLVTSTLDKQQYRARRFALGNAVVPAQLLLGVQRGLADCLAAPQPAQPDPHALNPGFPEAFLVDPCCYDPPAGWTPRKSYKPEKRVREAYYAHHHPALRTGISTSHNLTQTTDHDFDTNCRFASITAPGERGVDWRVALSYVEALMGLEPGWTSIEPELWAALGKRGGERGKGRKRKLETAEPTRVSTRCTRWRLE